MTERDRLLRLREVLAQTGLSRSGLYLKMQRGDFPKAVVISERRRAWRDVEVQRWIAQRAPNDRAQ